MANYNDTMSKLKELVNQYNKFQEMPLPKIPDYLSDISAASVISTVEIDEESTFSYQTQQLINQILEKSTEQIELLNEHNEQLASNYKKLEALYELKEKELHEAKLEAKNAKRYNAVMMIIAILSMLFAVASWLLPNILGGIIP